MTTRNELLKLRSMVETMTGFPLAPLPGQLYATVNELDARLVAIEKGLRELEAVLVLNAEKQNTLWFAGRAHREPFNT